ncbi:hypothetical protein V5P93_004626 [Actinokineospora auranticolor]|uniref:Putative HAF family extracellular repeat protein n=1 Tax=Actinokineospora auranticolor TaxID=155976 RepID=A0A2S6GB56_9PSEU|nr:hypothetical protein [Actinokineospora auranticolor]PPK60543.1 putative HAF family extracellular repeat protein [Actinokineospora auranticolor]
MAKNPVLASLAFLLTVGATPATAAPDGTAPEYGVTVLQPLPGDLEDRAEAINEHGLVVGASTNLDVGPERAVRWDRDGTAHALPTLGGDNSRAYGVNGSGVIVGESQTPDETVHAVRWDRGRVRDLGALPGDGYSSAQWITDAGVVYGRSGPELDGPWTAVRWTGKDGPTPVAVPPGYVRCAVSATAGGVEYGGCALADGTSRATRWSRDGTPVLLPTLGGDIVRAATERGVLVGASGVGTKVPVRWNRDDTLTRLSPVVGSPSTVASAISENGYIAGFGYSQYPWSGTPVRWDPDGTAHRLDLPPNRVEAVPAAVDGHGRVYGSVTAPLFVSDAVVWDRDGHTTALPNPDAERFTASGVDTITGSGLVLGSFFATAEFKGFAAVWRPNH